MTNPFQNNQRIERIYAGDNLPTSFAPFFEVSKLSPNAIRLCDWPEGVYAGKHLAHGLGESFPVSP